MNDLNNIAVVIIGRNEGARLIACLNSLKSHLPNIVYVDSASTDDSVGHAKTFGAHIVSLDMTKPFSAARARNAGVQAVIKLIPHVKFVQFVDGDCEVDSTWLLQASNFIKADEKVAVVCGRRREKYPNATFYNMLCDLEWNTPVGETKACGGDALMRLSVFNVVGGYRGSMIAGEEPELCVRIRQLGYKIWRLDVEMTLHDVNMSSFKQWWKRTMRAGYAFAEGAFLHGAAPEYHWVVESKRAWLWGFIIPLLILITFFIKPILGLFLLLIYPLQMLRLIIRSKQAFNKACIQAFFLTIGKFAEMAGQIKFLLNRYGNKQSQIIEYK